MHLTKSNTLSWLKIKLRRKILQYDKGHLWRCPQRTYLLWKAECFPSKTENKTRWPLLPLLYDIVLEVLIRTVRQEKAFRLVRKKTIFTYYVLLYVENSKESTFRTKKRVQKTTCLVWDTKSVYKKQKT